MLLGTYLLYLGRCASLISSKPCISKVVSVSHLAHSAPTAVERIRHRQDNRGQILALA